MMDTKEALKELEDLTVDYGNRNEEQIARLDEAIDMAMDALRNLPNRLRQAMDTINRKEAIDEVCKAGCGSGFCGVECDEVLALRNMQSAQPEKRTEERTETHACDLISRQAAIDAICDDWCGCTNANCPYGSETEHYCDGCDAIHILKTLPPSQTPSRPQAEMIQESYYSDRLVCSNYGTETRWDFEFCPYCGFKFKQTGGCGMIQIDIEMPEKCGLCPLFHAEHPMHCQGVKADRKKKIVAPYGQPRPDWCPLHEATADPDTVSRQQAIDALEKSRFPGAPYIDRGILIALREIKKLPSAQPEIVRCKDCEYGEQDEVGRWFCRSLGCQIGNEDGSGYCADAERRTDE